MNLVWVFLVSALGGGVGAVLAMMIYAMVVVSGTAEEAAEAYEAGYAAAQEHWREQLQRPGVGEEKAA
jgi:hypothetical protein